MSLFKNLDELLEYHADAKSITTDDDGDIRVISPNPNSIKCPHTGDEIDEFIDIYRPNFNGAIYGYDCSHRSYSLKSDKF